MIKRLLLAAALVAAPAAAAAIPPLPPPPRLLVVISIDQLAADLFDEYRPHFTAGLARLAGGTVYRNGYQSHAATETCPGHSTILTGAHPARTGIVANLWTDQSLARSDKSVYCAEDVTAPGSSSSKYTASPAHLLVPTLGERMKDRWPASRNVAVGGKDRGAIMMTGRRVDQRWYWSSTKFDTDLKSAPVPAVVPRVNAAIASALGQPRPPLEPPPLCQAKSRTVAVERRNKPVGEGRLSREAGDAFGLRASPELDGATLALAAGLVQEMNLGSGSAPDLLAISLAGTDYVGHTYGTGGPETCLQLLELDREIGDFLAFLDRRGVDYAVAVTGDHGGKDIPERERLAGVADAARVDPALAPRTMGKKLVTELGLAGHGLSGEGPFGDLYVDRSLAPSDRRRLLAAAVRAYRAHPQVEAVFTAEQIEATAMPTASPDRWSLIERARASYYRGRSGDFLVMLKRNVTPIVDTSRYIATHGSPWDYDRRVPIIFWRNGFAGRSIDTVVDTVDIMPTLASVIDLALPAGAADGKCLAGAAGATCLQR